MQCWTIIEGSQKQERLSNPAIGFPYDIEGKKS